MPIRDFFADDIFISYARKDSSTYAAGLADELTKRRFSCFIDRLGTEANAELPSSLRRKLRGCSLLVIVGTQWSGSRRSIREEIVEFKKTKRIIIPLDLDGSICNATWYKEIEGIAPEPERNANALDDGNPSPAVVSRIEKAFMYRKRNDRLYRWTFTTAVVLGLLIALSIGAGIIAKLELASAVDATKKASDATKEATDAKAKAAEATADATRQQAIAAARQIATRADTLRTQSLRMRENWGDTLRYSTLLSLDAAKRLSKFGIAPAESTESLREALNLLPREVISLPLNQRSTRVWLTPDGRHLIAQGESDGFLSVWDTTSARRLKSFKADGRFEFSPDMTTGYFINRDSVAVFRLPDFQTIRNIPVRDAQSVKFSVDGQFLAIAAAPISEKPMADPSWSIEVWDIRNGRQQSHISVRADVTDFALSDDLKWWAVSVAQRPKKKVREKTPTARRSKKTIFKSGRLWGKMMNLLPTRERSLAPGGAIEQLPSMSWTMPTIVNP